MIPNLPTIGIRFDIGKIPSENPSLECWRIFWGEVRPADLAGSLLYQGKPSSSSPGGEKVFLIALQSEASVVQRIEKIFDESQKFNSVSALPPFLKGDRAYSESLTLAGKVDLSGELEEADKVVIQALKEPEKKIKLDLKTLRAALKEASQKIKDSQYAEAVKTLLPILEIQPKNGKALELVRKALHQSDQEKKTFPLSLREDPQIDQAFFQCEVCFLTWNSDPANTLQATTSGGFTAGAWCSRCQTLYCRKCAGGRPKETPCPQCYTLLENAPNPNGRKRREISTAIREEPSPAGPLEAAKTLTPIVDPLLVREGLKISLFEDPDLSPFQGVGQESLVEWADLFAKKGFYRIGRQMVGEIPGEKADVIRAEEAVEKYIHFLALKKLGREGFPNLPDDRDWDWDLRCQAEEKAKGLQEKWPSSTRSLWIRYRLAEHYPPYLESAYNLLYQLGNTEDAPPEAEELYQKKKFELDLERGPGAETSGEDALEKAQILLDRSEPDKARPFAEAAVQLPQIAESWAVLGESYTFGEGRSFRKAYNALVKALKLNPKNPRANEALGCLMDNGKSNFYRDITPPEFQKLYREPLPHWERAMKDKKRWRAAYRSGLVYLEKGEPQKMKGAMEQAILSDPPDQSPYLYLEAIYNALGYPEKAREMKDLANLKGSTYLLSEVVQKIDHLFGGKRT